MDNFELNRRVVQIQGVREISDSPVNGQGVRCNKSFTRDFCGEKDGSRLMINKRIGLKPLRDGTWRAHSDNYVWTHNDKNPWRAVAMVYLKECEYYANGGVL